MDDSPVSVLPPKLDIVQARVRAATKLEQKEMSTGMCDLFADEAAPDSCEGRRSPDDVDAFWRQYLHAGERRVETAALVDTLESTDWFPGELQASLVRLVKTGEVADLDAHATKRRSKPLHFEKQGERLQLLK